MKSTLDSQPLGGYELHFQSLVQPGRSWVFPCDVEGHVDMDTMTDLARNSYLFARALVGIELDTPRVRAI